MTIHALLPEPLRRIHQVKGPMSTAQAARLHASSKAEAAAWMCGLGWTKAQAWTWLAWAGTAAELQDTVRESRESGLNPATWIPMVFLSHSNLISFVIYEGLGLTQAEATLTGQLANLRSSDCAMRTLAIEYLKANPPEGCGEALTFTEAEWRTDRAIPLPLILELHEVLFALAEDWQDRWRWGAERLLTFAGAQAFGAPAFKSS